MPKKSSRSVNSLDETFGFSPFLSEFTQAASVFIAAVLCLFSGGVTSVALGLIVLCPLTVAALTSCSAARLSTLTALVMFVCLLLMSFFGLIPPVPDTVSRTIDWIAVALMGVSLTVIMVVYFQRSKPSIDKKPDRASATAPTYHQDIAGLSHDLKSPLTSILGFSQLMRDRTLGADAALYESYPEHIHQSALALQDRVHTLLALMETESGALNLDRGPVDLSHATRSVLDRLGPVADRQHVKLVNTVLDNPLIYADPKALERILENLVSNAIKYSDKDDSVEISAQRQGDYVCLSVLDCGAGIGASDLAKLAQPFEQASHTGLREGTGLGLALVKRLVELQDGEFRIRTASGRGTEMIVKLPCHYPG